MAHHLANFTQTLLLVAISMRVTPPCIHLHLGSHRGNMSEYKYFYNWTMMDYFQRDNITKPRDIHRNTSSPIHFEFDVITMFSLVIFILVSVCVRKFSKPVAINTQNESLILHSSHNNRGRNIESLV